MHPSLPQSATTTTSVKVRSYALVAHEGIDAGRSLGDLDGITPQQTGMQIGRERRKKVARGVPKTGVQSLEDELVDGVRKDYLSRNITKLVFIQERVQNLPHSPFTHPHPRWCRVAAGDSLSRTRHSDGETMLAIKADERVKFVAYIPWMRVMDLKEGEEREKKC